MNLIKATVVSTILVHGLSAASYNSTIYNVHKVEPYPLYRSRQLPYKKELEVIKKHGIQLLLNLRPEENRSWCDDQKQAAMETDTPLVFAGFESGKNYPNKHSLLIMLAVIHNTKEVLENPKDAQLYPSKYLFSPTASTMKDGEEITIKVNCLQGADRTGLFSALYILEKFFQTSLYIKDNKYKIYEMTAYKKAKSQLSVWYKHSKFLFPAMDNFIDEWFELRLSNPNSKDLSSKDLSSKDSSLKDALDNFSFIHYV